MLFGEIIATREAGRDMGLVARFSRMENCADDIFIVFARLWFTRTFFDACWPRRKWLLVKVKAMQCGLAACFQSTFCALYFPCNKYLNSFSFVTGPRNRLAETSDLDEPCDRQSPAVKQVRAWRSCMTPFLQARDGSTTLLG